MASSAQQANFLKMIAAKKNAAPSNSAPKTKALQKRLGNSNSNSKPQDAKESSSDQQKIAAAKAIIAEQEKIIYNLQHNGK